MVAYSYLLSLLAATAAVASPAPIPNDEFSLEARAGQIYVCKAGADNNGQHYGDISYDKSIGFFRDAKTKTGQSGYPKPFDNKGNVMKFAKGCGKDVWELPVLANGKPYNYKEKKGDKNKPGPMRVYYTKDLKWCGIGGKLKPDGTGNPHNCQLKK
ncbi:hypothetical protein JDV02_000041 [Purpureocillium takamizusanense]|uniref:Uncharacterized protein n=1 Tax=Purpureocillium takamizusanense TaxID=2060973 RepID=A0A9Q8Q3Z6_9HYPO|nr:uncharacterized protein JDV02_000041 [Purpureocillium takamizusanense]UNI13284.1 hypothetical protein JDV02_000041 [Purpureocillium takamizusanense]